MSTNGVTEVLFLVLGNSASMGKKSQLRGTILAPHAKCTVGDDAQLIGALLCEKKIVLAARSQIIYVPTTIMIP
jgi:hypothetical protein